PLIGRTLGRYQIQSLLGAGGMGEVFLAEDTQLGRRAALKLLPTQFTTDAARVRRFEQEARAVLSLNHPNIVTLFDLGQADGAFFMATEYVEGETLRQRMRTQGALPAPAALELSLQIAAALTAAHAAGIIHRDIKPENVMIRRDGYVKVLDFGLAKIAESQPQNTDSEAAHSLTESGAVLGTARYMSPEQARGLRVDARTDVFSLGVVLYEMLAGRAPFQGATRGDLLVEILIAAPPPLLETAPATPAALETILHRALAKEADARYASVVEFAEALKTMAVELASASHAARALPLASTAEVQAAPARRVGDKPWLIVVMVALSLAGLWGWYFFEQPRQRFEGTLLSHLKFTLVDSWQAGAAYNSLIVDVAPDGHTFAYSRLEHGQSDIFIKQLPQGNLLNVTNDAWPDSSPLWSPNGRELAYLSLRDGRSEIWLIPSLGGQGRLLKRLDDTPRFLESWSRDGRRLFYEIRHNFYALDIQSGVEKRLTDFDAATSDKDLFALSADEQHLAYAESVQGVKQIWVQPLAGGVAIQVTREGEENQSPLWLPDGERLVYSSTRNGIAQICLAWLDGRQPVQLTASHENLRPWDVSPDGQRIFYVAETQAAGIYLHDLNTGAETEFLKEIYPSLFPCFAPDGQALAYQRLENGVNLFSSSLYTKQTSPAGRLTRLAENGLALLWSPLGARLAFLRFNGKSFGLWTVRNDGADARELVASQVSVGSYGELPFSWSQPNRVSWSPDETKLVYAGRVGNSAVNLWAIPAAGGQPQQLTDNRDATWQLHSPIFSPAGDQVAYLRQRETGGQRQCQVWLAAFSGPGRMLYQADGNVRLLGWSASGSEFLVGFTEQKLTSAPAEITILRLALAGAPAQVLTRLPQAYFSRNALAPDASQILYVAHTNETNGLDEVWLYSRATGKHKRLRQSADPAVFIAGLTWAPQQNQFGFIKQSNATSIWMIENFN
ncbi:MAG: protein kinase, partial [Acidobacteria bacterium]|nr:protein kinase [Acidobacteriota bacterium]